MKILKSLILSLFLIMATTAMAGKGTVVTMLVDSLNPTGIYVDSIGAAYTKRIENVQQFDRIIIYSAFLSDSTDRISLIPYYLFSSSTTDDSSNTLQVRTAWTALGDTITDEKMVADTLVMATSGVDVHFKFQGLAVGEAENGLTGNAGDVIGYVKVVGIVSEASIVTETRRSGWQFWRWEW